MGRVRIDEITPEWLRENLPQVAETLVGEGRSEGRQAAGAEREAAERGAEERGFLKGVRRENDRMIGVMQHAAKVRGCEDEGLRCLADPTVTAERAAGRLLQAAAEANEEKARREAQAGKAYLEDAERAEEENGKAKPSGAREESESERRVGAVKAMARKMGLAKEA